MALPLHHLQALVNRSRRRNRIFRDRTNPFDSLSDFEFNRDFRFSKNSAHIVIQLFRRALEPATQRNHALSPETKILLTLHYLGTNSVQRDDARLAGVKQPTACLVIHKVIDIIASAREEFISFPTGNARGDAENGFRRLANELGVQALPGVVSAVDGCHIRLDDSPMHPTPGIYYNRKSFYSVNAQFACDASIRCTNVVARWYGSAHDSRVFQNSTLDTNLGNGTYQGLLLADSAYPNSNYILKPLRDTGGLSVPEKTYNKSQIALRGIIERFNGVLKSRFRCLKGLRVHLKNVERIIVACAVLHNISLLLKETDPDQDNDIADDVDNVDDDDDFEPQLRADYIRIHFG